MKKNEQKNRRNAARRQVSADVEYYVTADIIKAKTVDVSEKGIRLDTGEPLEVEMRFTVNGKEEQQKARLCWVEKKTNGNFNFGFEFLPD